MKFIAIKNHKISFSQTHNLEVAGSNPAPATLKTSTYEDFVSAFLF